MGAAENISIQLPKSVVADIIMERLERIGIADPSQRRIALPKIGEKWEGGIYAGITIHDHTPHALILIPEDFSGDWKGAMSWADAQAAQLPSRFDALALFNNLKAEFKAEWHWTNAQNAVYESYAWIQSFGYGDQDCNHEDYVYRARAVRRLPIE